MTKNTVAINNQDVRKALYERFIKPTTNGYKIM